MNERDARLVEGAKTIARDLNGPAGAIPLDRIVARHLTWFALCQERGMSWPQICRLLHVNGAGRENGLPFTHGHLSAVVWRQRQKPLLLSSLASAPVAEPNRSIPRIVGVSRPVDPPDEGGARTLLRVPKPRPPNLKPKRVRRPPSVEPTQVGNGLEGDTGIAGDAFDGGDQPVLSGAEAARIRALMTRAAGRRR